MICYQRIYRGGCVLQALAKYFELEQNGTTVRRETLAGITTFLTMAYIVFRKSGDTGGCEEWIATPRSLRRTPCRCVRQSADGNSCQYPIALAPGMGLNAFFTYTVVAQMGHSWQTALGVVFLSNIIFLLLSVFPVREWIVNSIPRALKMAISAGIGMFLAIIALKNAGIVVDSPATLVQLGDPWTAGGPIRCPRFFRHDCHGPP